MKHLIISFLSLVLVSIPAFSQSNTGEITLKTNLLGTQFLLDGKRINMSQVMKIMEPNAEAYKYIKSARAKNTLSALISGVGGALIGWPVGTSMAGGDANWTLAAIGAGLVVVAIPISVSAVNKSKTAVGLYNDGLKRTSKADENSLQIQYCGNTISIRWSF